jgi:hypothetical protein
VDKLPEGNKGEGRGETGNTDPFVAQKAKARKVMLVFALIWASMVTVVVMIMPPEQKLGAALPLTVVGCLIGAMGYYSTVKKEVVKSREANLQKLLAQRRMSRAGKSAPHSNGEPPVVMPVEEDTDK